MLRDGVLPRLVRAALAARASAGAVLAGPPDGEETEAEIEVPQNGGNGTLIGLHQHETPAPDETFSEFRIGLDHVAFGVANRQELETWAGRLDELGIEHDAIKDATYGSGVSFRDPDGIPLEFFAPPG